MRYIYFIRHRKHDKQKCGTGNHDGQRTDPSERFNAERSGITRSKHTDDDKQRAVIFGENNGSDEQLQACKRHHCGKNENDCINYRYRL